MADIRWHLDVDSREWMDHVDLWKRFAKEEGRRANMDAARRIQVKTIFKLVELEHAPFTKTPSPKGHAPAMISGDLAGSVHVDHDGDDALVGPTAHYGRFLELGGTHRAHGKYMTWIEDGTLHRARVLKKTERPYLKPATEEAIRSGEITRIYADHWDRAQKEVT